MIQSLILNVRYFFRNYAEILHKSRQKSLIKEIITIN
jgi:hypothetical protein